MLGLAPRRFTTGLDSKFQYQQTRKSGSGGAGDADRRASRRDRRRYPSGGAAGPGPRRRPRFAPAATDSADRGKPAFDAAGTKSLLGNAFFGAPSRYFTIDPALSLPIFDGGRLRADLASSNADYDLAVAQYNQSLVSAFGDIGDAITRLSSLEIQLQQKTRARDIARESWDNSMQRYSAGIGNYLDALSVEQR